MATDAEALGSELAQDLDVEAARDEAEANDSTFVDALITAFEIQFQENQEDIQQEILDMVLAEWFENAYSSTVAKDDIMRVARQSAQYALLGYVNEHTDEAVELHALPDMNRQIFDFKDIYVQSAIERYEEVYAE